MTALPSTQTLPLPAPASAPIPRISFTEGFLRYRNDRVKLLAELGDARADIVLSRMGPLRLYFVTEAKLAQTILLDRSGSFRKGPAVDKHSRPLLGNGLLTCRNEDSRVQRKILAPKFQPRHIAGFAQTMIDLTLEAVARWRTETPTDVDREITRLTMSIAARTMFGSDITEEDIEALYEGINVSNRWIINRSTNPVSMPLWMPTARNRKVKQTISALDDVVYRLLAEHKERGTEGNVLSALLAARDDDGNGMTDELIRDQIITFFVAGHETISTTLGWAYRLSCERPELADQIAAEAEEVFGPLDAPSARPDPRGLTITNAVLQEVMRLRPAAYMIGRQATEDVEVGPHTLPAGSFVVVNTTGIHRRSDYFEDPLTFRHERFLQEPTWPKTAYQPFGAGRRVCIGKHFALMEGTIVLALICRAMRFHHNGRHDFDPEQGSDGLLESEPMITLRPTSEFPCTMTPR